jgi:hypothetical protein
MRPAVRKPEGRQKTQNQKVEWPVQRMVDPAEPREVVHKQKYDSRSAVDCELEQAGCGLKQVREGTADICDSVHKTHRGEKPVLQRVFFDPAHQGKKDLGDSIHVQISCKTSTSTQTCASQIDDSRAAKQHKDGQPE